MTPVRAVRLVNVRSAYFCLAIFILAGGGALLFNGAVDNRGGYDRTVSGPLEQLFIPVMTLFLLVSAIALLRRPGLTLSALRKQPVLPILILFALLSALWSISPSTTFVRSVALVGTTIIALHLSVTTCKDRDALNLGRAIALFLIGGGVAVILIPALAVHHDSHEGAWRGLASHKNQFGWVAALGFTCFVALARKSYPKRYIFLALTALMCVIGSRSATALASVLIAMFAYYGIWAFAKSGRIKPIVSLLAISMVVFFTKFSGEISSAALRILGRQPTLTGRTEIWAALQPVIAESPILGWGYRAFWDSEFALSAMRSAFFAGHAHNGYLDLTIDLGLIGLVLYISLLARVVYTHGRLALSGDPDSRLLFTLVVQLSVLGLSAPVIATQNSLYWFIFALAAIRATSVSLAPRAQFREGRFR